MASTPRKSRKLQPLNPCMCGCGRLTQRRYYPGCDTGFKDRLLLACIAGDREAGRILLMLRANQLPWSAQRRICAEYHARAESLAAD